MSKILNSFITASSNLGEGYEPWNGRYNRHHGMGAWCARDNKKDEFIEVDLKRVHIISRVAVQEKLKTSTGDSVGQAWVSMFVVHYSEDGLKWSKYSVGGVIKVSSCSRELTIVFQIWMKFVQKRI